MSEQQISAYLDMQKNAYIFSDGVEMPFNEYVAYIEEKLDGEYPTEPRETSVAIFKARELWERLTNEQ